MNLRNFERQRRDEDREEALLERKDRIDIDTPSPPSLQIIDVSM